MSKRIIPSILEHACPFQYVFIEPEGLEKLSSCLSHHLRGRSGKNVPNHKDYPFHPQPSIHGVTRSVDWIFFLDLLNFSFWTNLGDPVFSIPWDEGKKKLTGYATLCGAVKRAEEMGIPLTSPSYYGSDQLDFTSWKGLIFKGLCSNSEEDVDMPLLQERYNLVKHAGDVLLGKFGGSFVNCLKQADGNIYTLIDVLTENFPSFNDSCKTDTGTIWILKRAQILIADIWSCLDGVGLGSFYNIDEITMFADYRVPQSLQFFGVLRYSDELLNALASEAELEHNSRFELEIRAASILSVHRLLLEHGKDLDGWNAITIDFFLWDFAKSNESILAKFPIHRTRCIYY